LNEFIFLPLPHNSINILNMNTLTKVAIFASGNGSNAENIADYFKNIDSITIDSFYANKADAYVIERAKNLGIHCSYYKNSDFREGSIVLDELQERGVSFIVLAGFLLKVPENIIKEFPNKILNIHPALLPKFGGKGMYGDRVHQAVKEANETESGITIHYVNECFDDGKIVFQAKCEVLENDSADGIAEKVHALEYRYFPEVIEKVILKKL